MLAVKVIMHVQSLMLRIFCCCRKDLLLWNMALEDNIELLLKQWDIPAGVTCLLTLLTLLLALPFLLLYNQVLSFFGQKMRAR